MAHWSSGHIRLELRKASGVFAGVIFCTLTTGWLFQCLWAQPQWCWGFALSSHPGKLSPAPTASLWPGLGWILTAPLWFAGAQPGPERDECSRPLVVVGGLPIRPTRLLSAGPWVRILHHVLGGGTWGSCCMLLVGSLCKVCSHHFLYTS